ncbi:MAG TPA: sigma factor-like helix-turn-helix DNA-binding protein [Kofleriaceae bacterium]|nr:sigma factor-like helix-turn-helix DNA-binding protein [Kofleriaceae bacterium]
MLAHLDASKREEVAAIPDLEPLLQQQVTEGAAAWPTIQLEPEVYVRHLCETLRARADEISDRVIRTMPAADLYLAAACTAGDPAAIAAFHATFLPVIRPALAKLGVPDATIDETEQRVLIMVLVGDPVVPAISKYSGRGRLRSWVRSIGVRTGRRLAGVTAASTPASGDPDDDLDQLSASVQDPELELLRGRYRDEVRRALGEALGKLAERQRNVLRQYYLDGLTIDQLAALYHVDRATTARWVIAARSAVLAGTRDALRDALGATSEEIESILRLVRSQLDLSLRQLA